MTTCSFAFGSNHTVIAKPQSTSTRARRLGNAFRICCLSRADNRGNLRLYLDSASVYQWEKFSRREIFYGTTTNPALLQKDAVPNCNIKVYKILAKQAFDLGYQEVQLQAWGDDLTTLYSVALDIAAIDSRVSIKLPITADSITVAAQLKKQQALVTLTALYSAHQAVTAAASGADYAAPYLQRMIRAGKQGFKEVLEMNDIVKATESSMRILVASIASAADMTVLAAQGCDTFTISPTTADELFDDPLTAAAVADLEDAARQLGAYNR